MDEEAKALKEALRKKEQLQDQLYKLERLKDSRGVTPDQYSFQKTDYQTKMMASVTDIAAIKNRISSKLLVTNQRLDLLRSELDDLRLKESTTPEKEYRIQEKRLNDEIDGKLKEKDILERQLNSKLAGQVLLGAGAGARKGGAQGGFPKWAMALVIVLAVFIVGGAAAYFLTIGSWTGIAQGFGESVVFIYAQGEAQMQDQQGKMQNQQVDGIGSGVIIDPEGYILTNKHVAAPEGWQNVQLQVFLCEYGEVNLDPKEAYQAELVKVHPEGVDLAIIKIAPRGKVLRVATIGNSTALKPGEEVMVIGYPGMAFGYTLTQKFKVGPPTVTKGVVSAMREFPDLTGDFKWIQVDAAVNQGNSGGALVNSRGEFVGTPSMGWANVAIRMQEPSVVIGMNYCIPSNYAKPFIDYVTKVGK